MACAFNPAHPVGFAVIALLTAFVVLAILPLLDKIFAAAASPVSA